MNRRPNLVIFNPDQWRGDVMGHLGNPAARTPSLDHMATTDGVSFRNAFCQNPICTPSRCSFMSGWYPHVAGHRTQTHMLHEHEPNLLRTLKNNGYYVWWGGKNDLVPAQGTDPWSPYCHVKDRCDADRRWMHDAKLYAKARGKPGSDTYHSFLIGLLDVNDPDTWYDFVPPADRRHDGVYRDQDWGHVLNAVEFIKSKPPEPFCIFLALGNPHPPYAVEEPYFSLIDRNALPPRIAAPADLEGKSLVHQRLAALTGTRGWTEKRWNELRAVYYGQCARVDDQFGRVMSALGNAGTYDDTAVFFFADHGDFTGDYGLVQKTDRAYDDCLVRVPLIVKPPKGVACAPGVRDQLAELVDFSPTVYAITGIGSGHTAFGRSLLPVLADRAAPGRDAVFCEGGVSEEDWRRTLAAAPEPKPDGLYWVTRTVDRELGGCRATMCRTERHKYVKREGPRSELYDLSADPSELDNRIDDPAMTGVLAEMKERLLRWYHETADAVPFETDKRE